MTLIPCSERCIHQAEGMCTLDAAAAATDLSGSGCIHCVRPESPIRMLNRPERKPHP